MQLDASWGAFRRAQGDDGPLQLDPFMNDLVNGGIPRLAARSICHQAIAEVRRSEAPMAVFWDAEAYPIPDSTVEILAFAIRQPRPAARNFQRKQQLLTIAQTMPVAEDLPISICDLRLERMASCTSKRKPFAFFLYWNIPKEQCHVMKNNSGPHVSELRRY